LYEPIGSKVTEWTENALFYVNQEFGLVKNGKVQRRGRINLIGRDSVSDPELGIVLNPDSCCCC
jgi:cullin-5